MSDDLTEGEKEYLRSLAQWVGQQLVLGRSKDQIIDDLTRTGINKDTASSLVEAVTRPKPASSSRAASIFSTVGAWVIIVVCFLALNGVFYVAQEWYHAADVRRCEEIKRQLSDLDLEITSIERYLQDRERTRQEIERLEAELKQREGAFGTQSAYLAAYSRYKNLVDDYNSQVARTKQLVTTYKGLVNDYNAKVEEYNKLAKTAYSRWYLIPVLRGSSKALIKRSYAH